MSTVEEKRRQRFRFMEVVYNDTQGDPLQLTSLSAVAPAIGLSEEEAGKVGEYLSDEQLIQWSMGGGISITHRGVVEVEEAISAPAKPTQHFPPFNYIHVEHMTQSQIQQGTTGSVQQMRQTIGSDESESLKRFLAVLEEREHELQLPADAKAELEAQIATMESQMESTQPKRSILKEVGSTVLDILGSAPGRAAAEEVLKHVPDWLHH